MLRAIFLISVLLIGTTASSVGGQQAPAAQSVWINELGSTMTIASVGSDGQITGTYVTAVGCGAGTVRPLTGWYNQGAITFTVNWQGCSSLTSWTGTVGTAGSTIDTLWYLVLSGPPQWNSIVAGTDSFTLQ